MDFTELAPELKLHLRVDHGQRFVEQDSGDVGANQAAAERNLLFGIGGKAAGTFF